MARLPWWGSPPVVFLRSRGLLRAGVVLAGVAALGAAVPATPVPIRFRLAAVGLGPLVAALPGVLLPILLEHPEGQLEPARTGRLRCARAAWLGVVVVLSVSCGLLALGMGAGALVVCARSLGLTGGVGLLVAQRAPAVGAWVPAATVVVITLVYGTACMSGRPYRWAILLHSAGSPVPALTGAALFVLGAAGYIWRDVRP